MIARPLQGYGDGVLAAEEAGASNLQEVERLQARRHPGELFVDLYLSPASNQN